MKYIEKLEQQAEHLHQMAKEFKQNPLSKELYGMVDLEEFGGDTSEANTVKEKIAELKEKFKEADHTEQLTLMDDLYELGSDDEEFYQDNLKCSHCEGSGQVDTYEQIEGNCVINGQTGCGNCDGSGLDHNAVESTLDLIANK